MIYAVSFSPTLTTKKVVTHIAAHLAKKLFTDFHEIDYTVPSLRKDGITFTSDDLVIFGMPVYAGRVPNLIAKDIPNITGSGAKCVPVVLYGNRAFDDALIELRDLLINCGMKPLAAGAFVGQHSFSETLGAGRPNSKDLALCKELAELVYSRLSDPPDMVDVPGTPFPYGGYYQPRLSDGTPIDIRKVKPKTNERCVSCGQCTALCPMGAISKTTPSLVEGICIKCGACIKRCPVGAKYIDDEGYLAHKRDLEINQATPKESKIF